MLRASCTNVSNPYSLFCPSFTLTDHDCVSPVTPRQIWERYNPGKPLPTKEEIDTIFKDPQLEWAAMPDFSWGD